MSWRNRKNTGGGGDDFRILTNFATQPYGTQFPHLQNEKRLVWLLCRDDLEQGSNSLEMSGRYHKVKSTGPLKTA